jgi:hypothetical protein
MQTRNNKALILLLCGIVAIALGIYVWLPRFLHQKLATKETITEDPVWEVRTASSNLAEGFRRALSLGLSPNDLTYGTGGYTDLAGALNLLPRHMPVQIDAIPAEMAPRWLLGGGQITGGYQGDAPDLAFFLTPLPVDLCQKINREIWGSANSEPVMTGIPVEAWFQRKANMLGVFDGINRTEACIGTVEGKYLYYRLVYGTTIKGETGDASEVVGDSARG